MITQQKRILRGYAKIKKEKEHGTRDHLPKPNKTQKQQMKNAEK